MNMFISDFILELISDSFYCMQKQDVPCHQTAVQVTAKIKETPA